MLASRTNFGLARELLIELRCTICVPSHRQAEASIRDGIARDGSLGTYCRLRELSRPSPGGSRGVVVEAHQQLAAEAT
jgi:hypothetical protein